MSGLRRVVYDRILARYTANDHLTYRRICNECFCSYSAAVRNVQQLCADGRAHIIHWKKRNGNPMPIFVLSPGRDAPRPTFNKTTWHRDYNRRYRATHPTFSRTQALKKRAKRAGLSVTIHLI